MFTRMLGDSGSEGDRRQHQLPSAASSYGWVESVHHGHPDSKHGVSRSRLSAGRCQSNPHSWHRFTGLLLRKKLSLCVALVRATHAYIHARTDARTYTHTYTHTHTHARTHAGTHAHTHTHTHTHTYTHTHIHTHTHAHTHTHTHTH